MSKKKSSIKNNNFYELCISSSELYFNKYYLTELMEGDISIKYAELKKYISKFNHFFKKKNIGSQKKVLLIAENSNLTALIIICILANNRICIPINPKSSKEEIEYIAKDSKAVNIIFEKKFEKKINFLNLKKKICIDDNFIKKIDNCSENLKITKIDKKDIAEIVYTSGSTGKPKGVVLTHKNIISQIKSIHQSFKFKKYEKFLTITPLFHNSGQFFTTFVPLLSGGNVFTAKPELAFVNFFNYLKEKKINWSLGMGAHINFFLNQKKKIEKNSMKGILVGGMRLEKTNQIKFEKNYKFPILKTYGLTETCSFATVDSIKKSKRSYGASGSAISVNKIKIFDVNNDKELKNFQIGEIRIKGDNIFDSYLNKNKLTKEKIKKGWFCTGDLGYFDYKNNLFIEDRIDNMLIVSGENIYPAEIEKHLLNLKNVDEAYIVGRNHKIKGKELCMVYKSNIKICNEDISKWKKQLMLKLANYKIPTFFISVQQFQNKDFPRLANGKIDKIQLIKNIKKFNA